MAIVGYRFSRVTIAAVFIFLSVIALVTGCRIFSDDDDEGYYPQVTATSMSGRILVPADPASVRPAKRAALRPADLAGYVGVANAEVWIEDLADNPKYHSRTNASGVYVINDVPPGPHRVITRLENGGLAVMKNRSAEINVSETPGVIPVPDMPLLVAKNIVTGQLRDADGNFLPENTVLTLWGETFKVGKDGTFTSPPLPEDFSSAEIQVQLPNGNGATTFSAPFVSDIVPVVVDLKVGGSQETGNHAPSVILQAAQAGEIISKVSPGSSLVLTAVGSDLDESDRTMLSVTWEVTAGTLITGSSNFEKTWKAPDYQTLATITVEVKDPKGAVGVARLPILVGIDNPSQYDGARPSVTLSSEVTQVTDSAAFVVGISFDELVSGFALEDISVTNGTADNFSTVTAGRNYSVRVKPQAAGVVTIAVGENLARDVAGNGNRAANVLTVTNNVAPVLSSAKVLTAFAFSNPDVNCSIDEGNKTVTVTLPFGTDASALVANFTVSANATVKVGTVAQVSGTTANNFSSPVVYQIIAEDGSIAEYTVTVTVTQPVRVTALDLSSLVTAPVKGAAPVTTAINQTQYTSGAINWFEADGTTAVTGNFAAAKVYVARLTLSAKAGYTLAGVAANSFTYNGATSVANAANSGAVTITFASTVAEPVTAIAAITGTPQSGKTLTAGALTPVGATVDYKWQVSNDGLAGWVDIVGATANTYVVDLSKTATGKYVRVVATGKTNYSGTVNSTATQIGATPVTAIAATTGTPQSGQTLTAGALTPNDATVDYKWQVSNDGLAGWVDIAGATANTYVVDLAKTAVGKYVRVVATGKTNFSGTVNSTATQIGATPVTAIAATTGTPQSGQTLTAGALTPNDATVDYKWQVSNDGSAGWVDIAGATANTYVVDLAKTATGKYVRVVATGKTNFSGTVNSTATQIGATPVTAIAATTGTPQSGQTLTAGALTPTDATVDYKWQVSNDGSAGWVDIAGATANTYVVDLAKTATGKYVRVVAIGKTNYSGTVNSTATQIGATPVTAIAATTGTPQSGQTLTAGALSPNDATVDYKWQVSNDGSTGWVDIAGATANTYVVDLVKTAVGKHVRVVAIGKTNYSGSVNSTATQIGATPVTAIAATTGTPQSGQTLTAGSLTPNDATVDYKWQVSNDGSAGWVDIVGATANTYVVDLVKTAVGKHVRVVAIGKTNYSGTVNSTATQIGATPVTAIAATTGTPQSGQTLTAGALTPNDATVDYKWQVSDNGTDGWVDIVGATANTYVVDLAKTATGKYVRVVATGKTNYSGTVNSTATQIGATPVTAIAATTGTPQNGQTLTAGALTPNDATVDYKWQVSDNGTDGWVDIVGATANTYVVDLAKTAIGKYVRVVATGKTNYSGSVNSIATQIGATPVTAIAATTGTPQSGQTLTAGALTPNDATVDYKWQVSNDGLAGWVDIVGATANTYVVDLAKTAIGKYVRVVATGKTNFSGSVNSTATQIGATPVTAIAATTGTPQSGQTMTAGALTPNDATVDYKWQVSDNGTDSWVDIAGATANTYVVDLAKTAVGKHVRVVATGKTNYSGSVNSTATQIGATPVTAIAATTGTPQSGQTLTAGALSPNDATVDYKWQVSNDGSTGWVDIAGATANTYVVDLAKTAVGKYVRVVATGKTNFSGTVNSTATQIGATPVTAIGAITGISISGQTLTAGALTPVGATVDYKWQVSAEGSTGWTDISDATGNTYVVDLAKTAVGQYVRVVATGNGTYGSTVNSAAVKVVTAVTAIGAVSGVPMSGQTLTAGALTPVGATVDYKWQVSDDGSTGWSDIGGATANTYVVGLAVGKYVRAVATGNGDFGGVVNSAAEKIQGMPTMVSVPAGTFQRDATPANTSFVSAFSMSAHEITRAQFARFMGTDPSDTTYSSGRADPVQMTNWYHAIAFCNKLSLAEGLTPAYAVTGVDFSTLTYAAIPTTSNATWDAATCNWSANGYRLPTEMEWMWAAMGAPADGQGGGTNTTGYLKAFAGSNGSNSLDAYAWYATNSGTKTHPSGTKLANELGLYDMSGNVLEWCWDWYGYPANSNSDYRGAVTVSYRVIRGGSFFFTGGIAAVAYRDSYSPGLQSSSFGFRVVRPVITPLTAIGAVSGTPKSGQTLTAGALTPGYAAVNYQWQVSDNGSSGWSNITGETANTYVVDLAKTASGQFVRVAATGKDSYSGTVYSSALNIWGDLTSANIGTLKYVPAGTFQRDATPANTSAVSGFRMAQHEVTRTQFSTIMGSDPANTTFSSGGTAPVQMTNWYHAIAFCNKLSLVEGLTPVYAVTGVDFSTLTYAAIPTTTNATWDAVTCDWEANGYRLPTEMEWMWAAMGADQDSQPGAMSGGVNVTGYAKTFAGYNGSNSLDAYAWYNANSSSTTHPAGTKLANELGLYDMSGNVWEWCWDWYGGYPANSSSDYRGAGTSSLRVVRGGGYYFLAAEVAVARRYCYYPIDRDSSIGFRVVRP